MIKEVKNMITNFKRITAIILSAFLVLNGTAYAALVPESSALLATNDFESGKEPYDGAQDIYVSNASAATDTDAHNTYASCNTYTGNDTMGENGRITFKQDVFKSKPEQYIVSFDMKIMKKQAVRYYIKDFEAGYFAYMIFTQNGKIAFMKSPSLPSIDLSPSVETSSYGVADYEVGEWNSIDMYVDTVNKIIKYYVNGNFISQATYSADTEGYVSFFLSQSNPTDEALPFIGIDNVEVSAARDDAFYAYASYDGKNVVIDFSQWTQDLNLDEISLTNTETDEKAKTGMPQINGKRVIIPINESLVSDTEYCVKFSDELKSFIGKKIFSDRVYFMAPINSAQLTNVIFDDFQDYSDNSEQVNTPENWIAQKHGSFNHIDFYGDSEHDKAVSVWNTGWTRSIFTRNFGTPVSGKFEIEFDYKPIDYNKYIEGEDDPNLLDAVTKSVQSMAGNSSDYKTVNHNFGLYFAPQEENGVRQKSDGTSLKTIYNADLSYVSNDALKYTTPFFGQYADMLGFSTNFDMPAEGNYVKVEKDKWYHIALEINTNSMTLSGSVNGETIGSFSLPGNVIDNNFEGKIGRVMLVIPPEAHYNLKNHSVKYNDSETGEEKSYSRVHDSKFAIDNFKLNCSATEFKAEQVRLYDMDNDDFAPLQTVSSIVNTISIKFSENADMTTVNGDNVKIIDESGKEYPFEIESYDDSKMTLKIRLSEFLKKNNEYTLKINNVSSTDGREIKDYSSKFRLTDKGIFRVVLRDITDGSGNALSDGVSKGTKIYPNGYILNTEDDKKTVNLFAAGYKNTSDGEKVCGIVSETIDAVPASRIDVAYNNSTPLFAELDDDADYIKIYTDVEGEYKTESGNLSCVQSGDYTILIKGKTIPNQLLKIDIPMDSSVYESDKGCEMFYRNTVTSDENGAYEVRISAKDKPTGIYDLYVYNIESGILNKTSFVFADPIDTKTAVEQLNNASSIDEIKEITDNNHYALGIYDELYRNGNSELGAKLLNEELKKEKLSQDNSESVFKLMNKIFAVTVINGGKTSNLFDLADEIDLDNSKLKENYKKDFVKADVQKAITTDLKGQNFKSTDDFYDTLLERFILNIVANPDGYGNAKSIIEYYVREIGISKEYTDKAYRLTSGKVYANYSELVRALNNNSTEAGGSSTGGTSGSGGGIRGGNSSNISDASVPSDTSASQNEKLNYDIFDDIECVSWAKQAIVYLTEKGMVNGTAQNKFSPNDYIKREEIAKILVNAFAKDVELSVIPFDDVQKGTWYYEFVSKAYGSGIAKGYDDSRFGVGDNITRQDMAVMIYNAYIMTNNVLEQGEETDFDDDADISDYAKEAVYKLKSAGIINGSGDNLFMPLEFATRAEAAKIIYGLFEF